MEMTQKPAAVRTQPPFALSAIALVVLLALLPGCRGGAGGAAARGDAPPVPVNYPEARARIQKRDPTAKVGRVIAVIPDERMAAVGDINVQEFQRGDVLQIVGANDDTVASAVVLSIVDNTLHVRYTPVGEGGRRAYVGDLAIRFTMPVQ